MIKYLLKRIGTAIVTLFIAATLTFFIMNLVPGDPFLSDKAPTEAARAALRAKYGLDRPLVVQYTNYMKNLLHGDFGVSYVQAKNKPIRDIIAQSFPISANTRARWPGHPMPGFSTISGGFFGVISSLPGAG